MKAIHKHLLLLTSFLTLSAAATQAQVVYKTDTRGDAEVKVYVSQYKGDADLLVYKTEFMRDADGNRGIWYFSEFRSMADKRVYISDFRGDADIVICYTQDRGEAGWRNSQKKELMEKKK